MPHNEQELQRPLTRRDTQVVDAGHLKLKQLAELESRAIAANTKRAGGATLAPEELYDAETYEAYRGLVSLTDQLKRNNGLFGDAETGQHMVPRNVEESFALDAWNRAQQPALTAELPPGSSFAAHLGAGIRTGADITNIATGAIAERLNKAFSYGGAARGPLPEAQDTALTRAIGPSPFVRWGETGAHPAYIVPQLMAGGVNPVTVVKAGVRIPVAVAKLTGLGALSAGKAIAQNIAKLVTTFKTFNEADPMVQATYETLVYHFSGYAKLAEQAAKVPQRAALTNFVGTADDLLPTLNDPRVVDEIRYNGARYLAERFKLLTQFTVPKFTYIVKPDGTPALQRSWTKWNLGQDILTYINPDLALQATTPQGEAIALVHKWHARNAVRASDALNATLVKIAQLPHANTLGAPLVNGLLQGVKGVSWAKTLRPGGLGGAGTKALRAQAGESIAAQYTEFARDAFAAVNEMATITAARGFVYSQKVINDMFRRGMMYQEEFAKARLGGNRYLTNRQLSNLGDRVRKRALEPFGGKATKADSLLIRYEFHEARRLYLTNHRAGADPVAIVKLTAEAMFKNANDTMADAAWYPLRALTKVDLTKWQAKKESARLKLEVAQQRLAAAGPIGITPAELRIVKASYAALKGAYTKITKRNPIFPTIEAVSNLPSITPRGGDMLHSSSEFAALEIAKRFPLSSTATFNESEAFIQRVSDLQYTRDSRLFAISATLNKINNAMTLAYDTSVMFVTGALMLPAYPEVAIKSWGYMMRSIVDPDVLNKFLQNPDVAKVLEEMATEGIGLKTTTTHLIGRSPSDIDVGGKVVAAAATTLSGVLGVGPVGGMYKNYIIGTQRAFDVWGDVSRVLLWRSLRGQIAKAPNQVEARRDLADFVSKMTGFIEGQTLGRTVAEQQFDSTLWRTPRYLRAGLSLLLDMGQGGPRGALARDAFLSWLGGMTFLNMANQIAVAYGKHGLNADWDRDIWPEVTASMTPVVRNADGSARYNSNFMTFGAGGFRFSPFGGLHFSQLALAARAYAAGLDPEKWLSTANPFYKSWRYKSGMVPDAMLQWKEGEDAVGNKVTPASFMLRHTTPVFLQPLWDTPEGLPTSYTMKFASVATSWMGWRSFEQSVFDRRGEARNEEMLNHKNDPEFRRWVRDPYYLQLLDDDRLEWDQLPLAAQHYLINNSEGLRVLDPLIEKSLAEHGTETQQALQLLKKRKRTLQDSRLDSWNITHTKATGPNATMSYVEAYDEIANANAQYGREIERLFSNTDDVDRPALQKAQEYLNDLARRRARGARPGDKAALFDAAFDEYLTQVAGGDYSLKDEFGQVIPESFNAAKRRLLLDEWLLKWKPILGNDIRIQMTEAQRFSQDAPPIVLERDRALDLFGPYYDSYKKMQPSATLRIYEKYRALLDVGNSRDAARMLANPSTARSIARVEQYAGRVKRMMRVRNPELDAQLARWRGTKPITSAAAALLASYQEA